MPNNRVVNKTKTVTDVMEEQTTAAPEATPAEEVIVETAPAEMRYDTVDIDLTQSSETMLYSEVIDMGTSPENYVGKIIKVHGQYMFFHDLRALNH